MFKFLRQLVIKGVRYFFGYLCSIFLPLVIIYSWGRFALKKIFKQKPVILFSFVGSPLAYFAVRALRTAGYEADNIAYDCPKYFRMVSFGLILADHPYLRRFLFIFDYLPLFYYALTKYDHFEFPFYGGILMHSNLRKAEYIFLKLCAKKITVYGHGSDCKVLSDVRKAGYKYNNAMDRDEKTESWSEKVIIDNVARAKKYADILVAGGDLIHFGKKGIMIPLATDLKLWPFQPVKKHRKVIIVHSTNHRSHKGTRFILDIVAKLEKKLPLGMMLIEKKTMKDCQKLYPKADIFIPDVITGWHGFTAIEAMLTGRPVITYLRPDIAKFHAYYALDNIPAISANPDNLAKVITKLVNDPKLRLELGLKGREYAQKFHSLAMGGKLRSIIYEYIWSGKKINQKVFEREVKKRGLI